MDMLELFPRAVRIRPKPFVLLLDRVRLDPQPLVLVKHGVDGGRVMLDRLDPSERVAQRRERFGQWRVRWERHDRVRGEPELFGDFRPDASLRSASLRGGRRRPTTPLSQSPIHDDAYVAGSGETRAQGLVEIVMLTGDDEEVHTSRIARFDEVRRSTRCLCSTCIRKTSFARFEVLGSPWPLAGALQLIAKRRTIGRSTSARSCGR